MIDASGFLQICHVILLRFQPSQPEARRQGLSRMLTLPKHIGSAINYTTLRPHILLLTSPIFSLQIDTFYQNARSWDYAVVVLCA